MIKYSIIIPHYNAPELLMRCLRSIPISEEIQVIVVDDCSPQADKYISMYPELSRPYLELYSTGTNGGGGKARNVGLAHAKGEWVLFADSDDFFVDNAKEIWSKYYENKSDIIFFNVKCCTEKKYKVAIRGDKELLYEMYAKRKEENIFRYCYTVPWGKMIRRNLIENNNILFEEVSVANDFLFSVKTGYYAKSITISQDYIYWYVLMENSTCHGKKTLTKTNIRLHEKIKVQKFLESHNVKSDYNLISYVSRFKDFFPLMTMSEIKTLHSANYPIWPVFSDRIRLMLRRLVDRKFILNPNTRHLVNS